MIPCVQAYLCGNDLKVDNDMKIRTGRSFENRRRMTANNKHYTDIPPLPIDHGSIRHRHCARIPVGQHFCFWMHQFIFFRPARLDWHTTALTRRKRQTDVHRIDTGTWELGGRGGVVSIRGSERLLEVVWTPHPPPHPHCPCKLLLMIF